MSPSTTYGKVKKSDRRIPGHRDLPIAGCGLFNMGKRREGIVNPMQEHLLRRQHVVDLAARSLRPNRFVIEKGVPAGVAYEQKRRMGQIALDEEPRRAGRDE